MNRKIMQKLIEGLETQRENLYSRLHPLNIQYNQQYTKYQELGEFEEDQLSHQLSNIEQKTTTLEAETARLNQECQRLGDNKKGLNLAIGQYEEKRQRLNDILSLEARSLERIQASNAEVQQSIKLSRDQYQRCQQEIYDLDTKADNITKYGLGDVPPHIMYLYNQKQCLKNESLSLDRQIDQEKRVVSKMVSKEEFQNMQGQIEVLRRKNESLQELRRENIGLALMNEQLNETKARYEWNPNLEIKSLENNLQEQEYKIGVIEKEISTIHKKSSECIQKIEQYKNYLHKFSKNAVQSDSQKNIKEAQRDRKGKSKISIFEEIRSQIVDGKEGVKQRGEQGKAKVKGGDKGEGRTYLRQQKVTLIQLYLVMIILLGLIFWCHWTYKR